MPRSEQRHKINSYEHDICMRKGLHGDIYSIHNLFNEFEVRVASAIRLIIFAQQDAYKLTK